MSLDVEQTVLRAVAGIAGEMVDFLRGLIRIPTLNPPGRDYAAAAAYIGARLHDFGYEVDYVPAGDRPEHSPEYPRINVIGRLPGHASRPLLHFNGHFDVVPVGQGWTVDPFAAILQDGKLYGRGAADQKAGIAASLYAVEAIRRSGIRLSGTVEQSGTVDEESGGFAGVACLAARGLIHRERVDAVIITEPTNVDRICIGHRGVYWFKVIQHGRIAHGSMPHLGISAADHLAAVIHEINHTLKPRLAERKTAMPVEPPQSRRASININSLFGGQPEDGAQSPCVIDRAGAIFDRRFLAEESFAGVRREICQLLERVHAANPSAGFDLEDLMIVHPTAAPPSSQLVRTMSGCIDAVLGKNPPLIASPGTYDQKHVTRIGLIEDCIAYGPGILDLAHQPDEYVLVDDLIHAAQVMALACLRLLGTA